MAINEGNSNTATSQKPARTLQTNPFTTYRDPQTGRWIVVKGTTLLPHFHGTADSNPAESPYLVCTGSALER